MLVLEINLGNLSLEYPRSLSFFKYVIIVLGEQIACVSLLIVQYIKSSRFKVIDK